MKRFYFRRTTVYTTAFLAKRQRREFHISAPGLTSRLLLLPKNKNKNKKANKKVKSRTVSRLVPSVCLAIKKNKTKQQAPCSPLVFLYKCFATSFLFLRKGKKERERKKIQSTTMNTTNTKNKIFQVSCRRCSSHWRRISKH